MITDSDRLARGVLGRLARYRRYMWKVRLRDSPMADPERLLMVRRSHEDSQYIYSIASETYKRHSKMPKYAQETA